MRVVQQLIELPGVTYTRGDPGQHLWVYTTPDATDEQIRHIVDQISALPVVDDIRRLR